MKESRSTKYILETNIKIHLRKSSLTCVDSPLTAWACDKAIVSHGDAKKIPLLQGTSHAIKRRLRGWLVTNAKINFPTSADNLKHSSLTSSYFRKTTVLASLSSSRKCPTREPRSLRTRPQSPSPEFTLKQSLQMVSYTVVAVYPWTPKVGRLLMVTSKLTP